MMAIPSHEIERNTSIKVMTAQLPTVSVVIPLYNKGPHIARALNSVLNQTFQDFEVIVVDSSTDDGTDIVKGFNDPRIRLIQQEKQGVSAARNLGIDEARAELIAFLDADDEWLPDHLNIILRLRERFPEAGAYTTAYFMKYHDKCNLQEYHNIPPSPWEGIIPDYFKSASVGRPPVTTSAVAIPKRIFEDVGKFSIETWWGEDMDQWGRIAIRYPIAFSWKGAAVYHLDAVNRASDKREKPLHESPFVKEAKEILSSGDVLYCPQNSLEEYISIKEISRAWAHIRVNKKREARAILNNLDVEILRWRRCRALLWTYLPYDLYLKKVKIMELLHRRL